MNISFLNRYAWFSLILVCLAYALVGWYLSAHHIVWFVGFFIASVALYVAGKSSPLIERLINLTSQELLAALFLSFTVSALIVLTATWSMLWTLILIPISTTFLAELEMRFVGFNKADTFWILTISAVLGLLVGEITDIMFIPSSRY